MRVFQISWVAMTASISLSIARRSRPDTGITRRAANCGSSRSASARNSARRLLSSTRSHLLRAMTSARPSRSTSRRAQVLLLERDRRVEQQHHDLGEAHRAQGVGDRELLELLDHARLAAQAGGVEQPQLAPAPFDVDRRSRRG